MKISCIHTHTSFRNWGYQVSGLFTLAAQTLAHNRNHPSTYMNPAAIFIWLDSCEAPHPPECPVPTFCHPDRNWISRNHWNAENTNWPRAWSNWYMRSEWNQQTNSQINIFFFFFLRSFIHGSSKAIADQNMIDRKHCMHMSKAYELSCTHSAMNNVGRDKGVELIHLSFISFSLWQMKSIDGSAIDQFHHSQTHENDWLTHFSMHVMPQSSDDESNSLLEVESMCLYFSHALHCQRLIWCCRVQDDDGTQYCNEFIKSTFL